MGIIHNMLLAFQQLIGSSKSIATQIEEVKASALNRIRFITVSAKGKLDNERIRINELAKENLYADTQQPFFSEPEKWQDYKPILEINNSNFPDKILIGYWVDYSSFVKRDAPEILVPAYLPFFRYQHTIFIDVNNATIEKGHSLMKAMIERVYTIIPHYSKFTLIDPVTHGAAFPMSRDVETRRQKSDIYHLLDAIVSDATQITKHASLREDGYFGARAETCTRNEKFEIICAANFPNKSGYDRRVIESLANLGNSGYISGKFLIIVNNIDKKDELPCDFNISEFEGAIHLDLTKRHFYNAEFHLNNNSSVVFIPEEECKPDLWREITNAIQTNFKPIEKIITWEDHIEVEADKEWTYSSKEIIETPIGDANDKPISVWFGKKDGYNCTHGMLAATTGAGKSNFYHALILGLARRYSPKELRMYLIDGKNGVEFEIYKKFPHAEVVSLKSSSELAGSILTELVNETKRRNEIFKQAGVNSFDDYRKNPANEMPRILLLIDEYQVLFEGDDAMEASKNLHSLTAQARSAGIHLLLGSQHFGAPNMLNKDIIFTNIQLYVAMKMTMDDRLSLTKFGKEGKELIRKCEMPGQIVVNQNGGGDGYNQLGKVAFVKKKQKEDIISGIIEKAVAEQYDEQIMRTIIFEGDSAPNMDTNPELISCLEKAVLSPIELQKKASTPEREGGFGKKDWNVSERPMICWMGQELNVYGQCSAVIRRRKMENMLIVGDKNPYRYGMLVSTLFSLAATYNPSDIEFHVYDRSAMGTEWNKFLCMMANDVLATAGYTVYFATKVKDIKADLHDVVTTLYERRDLDQDERMDLKTIILIMTEPEDIEDLNLVQDKMGFKMDSEMGKELEFIYSNGTIAGIHLILSSSGMISLLNVVQKKQLQYFRHRVTLQISEQESFDLLVARDGSRLQIHGDEPVMALYKDVNGNTQTKFKPYSVTDIKFDNQFNHLRTLILNR